MPDALSLQDFFSLTAPRITPLYALTLLLLTLYWWRRVAREGREGRVPRAAWWSVPGLVFMLFAPILEQPTFFGVGAFMLLFAEFWPGAYRRAQRLGWWWPALGALLGTALLVSVMRSTQSQRPALAASLALLLSGVAGLVSALAWPRSQPGSAALPGWPRWMNVTVPEWPDLSVTLTGNGAELRNVSASPLNISGWSPARMNGWLTVRNTHGEPVHTLAAGESAWLPIGEHISGVRVWYQVNESSGEAQARLFRADWTPAARQQERVLN